MLFSLTAIVLFTGIFFHFSWIFCEAEYLPFFFFFFSFFLFLEKWKEDGNILLVFEDLNLC